MAYSKPTSPGSDRDRGKVNYRNLLQPMNEWAFTFILNTCCLDPRLCCDRKHVAQLMPELKNFSCVGSSAQGLSLSSYESLAEQKEMAEMMSDIDFMGTANGFVVDPLQWCIVDSETVYGYSSTTETHPGYLRVELKQENVDNIDEDFVVKRGSKYYFKARKLIESSMSMYPQSVAHKHGPGSCDLAIGTGFPLHLDNVVALKCSTWPAIDWVSRTRPSGWPSKALIAKVVSEGCHVVSKSHPTSSESNVEIEFRYSFSMAEVEICKEFSEKQKQCSMLFKLAVMNTLKQESPSTEHKLSSYHLKTVLWWVCENIAPQKWTRDTIGSCLLALLDQLLEFLFRRNIPNYFLPENNMISHFPAPVVQSLILLVEGVRSDPVGHLFSSVIILQCKPDEMFQPVIDVLPCMDTKARLEASVSVLQNGARSATDAMRSWRMAKAYTEEQSILLKMLGCEVSSSSLLTGLLVETIMDCPDLGNLNTLVTVLENFLDFLFVQGQFSTALSLLCKVKHICRRSPDSEISKGILSIVTIKLSVCYQQLGKNKKAVKLLRPSLPEELLHACHESLNNFSRTTGANFDESSLQNLTTQILGVAIASSRNRFF